MFAVADADELAAPADGGDGAWLAVDDAAAGVVAGVEFAVPGGSVEPAVLAGRFVDDVHPASTAANSATPSPVRVRRGVKRGR